MSELYPLRLTPSWREKIWGSTKLEPLFGSQDKRIGEIWFTFDDNTIANGPCAGQTLSVLMRRYGSDLMGTSHARAHHFPILIKFLFTSDRLSVQVHPGGEQGKSEMWYILRADPGSAIALGLTKPLDPGELRRAAESGEIAEYLNWLPVKPGDAIFCPAGTPHSIGAGLALCEIQQNCDTTYRFFDFGRKRDLHIEEAVAATRLEVHPVPVTPQGDILVACEYFVVEEIRCMAARRYEPDPQRMHLLVFLAGKGRLDGETYEPGDVYLAPAGIPPFDWNPATPTRVLRSYVPGG